MALFDKVRTFFGSPGEPKPAELPRDVEEVAVDKLSVHTAHLSPDTDEVLVIITMSQDGLEAVRSYSGPLRLRSAEARPVTLSPAKKEASPVVDPNHGWIIPVTAETAAELRALPPGPGEHELATLHVAFVVE